MPCWPVPRARGVLPWDIASSARQGLSSMFTAPVGWKSTAFHPEVRAPQQAIQRRERRPPGDLGMEDRRGAKALRRGPPVRDLDERRGRGEATGSPGGEAGDGLLGGGNGALSRGDDLIRQSGDPLRDPPQGQEITERALDLRPAFPGCRRLDSFHVCATTGWQLAVLRPHGPVVTSDPPGGWGVSECACPLRRGVHSRRPGQ